MMDLATIRHLSREQAKVAAHEGAEPFVVDEDDIEDFKHGARLPFPNIGDYRPEGYRLVRKHFVDKTGLGRPGEPALTIGAFLEKLKPGYGYAIVEEGQFQLYVGEFYVK